MNVNAKQDHSTELYCIEMPNFILCSVSGSKVSTYIYVNAMWSRRLQWKDACVNASRRCYPEIITKFNSVSLLFHGNYTWPYIKIINGSSFFGVSVSYCLPLYHLLCNFQDVNCVTFPIYMYSNRSRLVIDSSRLNSRSPKVKPAM